MAAEADLAALNDRLVGSKDARGVRGGLGRVKSGTSVGDANDKFSRVGWGAVFAGAGKAAVPQKWPPAGEDPLYRRFTRGPVLGGTASEEKGASGSGDAEASVWRKHIEAALRAAGGELPWPDLRDRVVKRRRKAGGDTGDESLWPHLALAHIPEEFLSKDDPIVRLSPAGEH
mmetsp:Transcript_117996/g.338446  ORF Transcript_117996/g.338446 Transcript_117996/m.338446 type:complete len:173 (+) Transcript_117996:69-587(+)